MPITGIHPDGPTQEEIATYIKAAKNGDMSTVCIYLNKYGRQILEAREENTRMSALLYAAWNGHVALTKRLLDGDAHINQVSSYHKTPLMYAASAGHLLVVELLLERGANSSFSNPLNQTAADIATSNKHPEIADTINRWPEIFARKLEERAAQEKADREDTERLRTETRLEMLKRLAPPKPVLKRKRGVGF